MPSPLALVGTRPARAILGAALAAVAWTAPQALAGGSGAEPELRPVLPSDVSLAVPLALQPDLQSAVGAALPAPVQPPAAEDAAPVLWKGKKYDFDELPAELTPAARKAVLGWARWADLNDCGLALTDDQRVLLIQNERRKPKKAFKSIEETAAIVDDLLPVPERPDEERTLGVDGASAPVHNEDGSWSWSWEDGVAALETDTAVILQLRGENDQVEAVEKLARDFEYLRDWGEYARQLVGFSLERPLCAAWLETAAGQEEWEPEHELINRVSQLLVLRRFGQLPFWLQQGLAWHVEWEVKEAIYCYPYRAEFVYASEHRAWPTLLRQEFKGGKREPLELGEVADWKRGVFDRPSARKAFGFARFIAQHHPESFSPILEDLRLFRDEHGRVTQANGNWTRIVGYEVPEADQHRIFAEHLGEDYLDEASEYFAKGKSYRPPSRD